MPLPPLLDQLEVPVIGAPMLTPASPALVIAQCTSGIAGAFPAQAARPQAHFDEWLCEIEEAIAAFKAKNPRAKVGPIAVNQIVHRSNTRQDADMAVCLKHRVPLIITSLGPNAEIVKDVHAYGGLVFHDVASTRHAEKALEQGVDGLVLVCSGAGGNGGWLNPFAFVAEIRRFFSGPLALAGTISTGRGIAAAQMMGADIAYIGTLFIATEEANSDERYRRMLVASEAKDVIFSPYFNGVHCNWLKPSIAEMGLDPDDPKLLRKSEAEPELRTENIRRYTDILCAGQGVGAINRIEPAAQLIARLKSEYRAALDDFAKTFPARSV